MVETSWFFKQTYNLTLIDSLSVSSAGHWTWRGRCCSEGFPIFPKTFRWGTGTLWAAWGTSESTADPSTWTATSLTTAPLQVRRDKRQRITSCQCTVKHNKTWNAISGQGKVKQIALKSSFPKDPQSWNSRSNTKNTLLISTLLLFDFCYLYFTNHESFVSMWLWSFLLFSPSVSYNIIRFLYRFDFQVVQQRRTSA